MHIGLLTHFNVSQIKDSLEYLYRSKARLVGGRRNTPVCNLLPAYLDAGFRVSIFAGEQSVPG